MDGYAFDFSFSNFEGIKSSSFFDFQTFRPKGVVHMVTNSTSAPTKNEERKKKKREGGLASGGEERGKK